MQIAFYQPDIPQNLGAAIRLTACLGVPLNIIEPCAFPLTQKGLRRAAMDYHALADIRRHAAWDDFQSLTQTQGRRLVLFTTRSASRMDAFTFSPDDILVFGRESAGVPDDVHAACDAAVFIPIQSGARSLNLVTAASMALAEALRQTEGFP